MFEKKHLDYILDRFYDKYEVLCKFENEETWTLTKTSNDKEVFEFIENFFHKPALSFELKDKEVFNPCFLKTYKYEQMELF